MRSARAPVQRPGASRWLGRILGGAALLLLGGPLHAQTVDVPLPDELGNFQSSQAAGDRGPQEQRLWLVVDRDPRGLLCRDDLGRPSIALKYGTLVETAASAGGVSPLQMKGSGTWLRVKVKPVAVLYDARLRGRGGQALCLVRANSIYLAPVNADSLRQALQPSP